MTIATGPNANVVLPVAGVVTSVVVVVVREPVTSVPVAGAAVAGELADADGVDGCCWLVVAFASGVLGV